LHGAQSTVSSILPPAMAPLALACFQKLSEENIKSMILEPPSPVRNRQVSEAMSLCSLDSSASMHFCKELDAGASGFHGQAEEVKTPCSLRSVKTPCSLRSVDSLDSMASMHFRRENEEDESRFYMQAEEVKTPCSLWSLDSSASMHFQRNEGASQKGMCLVGAFNEQAEENALDVHEHHEYLKTPMNEPSVGYLKDLLAHLVGQKQKIPLQDKGYLSLLSHSS